LKFNDWMDKVNKLQTDISVVALKDISETISCDGDTITVTLGKKQATEINGAMTGIRYLRSQYTHNKEEFDAMLESLEDQAKELKANSEEILLAITDEAVPGAVIARMKGGKEDSDAISLLKQMVEKKLTGLQKRFRYMGEVFEDFDLRIKVRGKVLAIRRQIPMLSLDWGSVEIDRYGNCGSGDVQGNLAFLGAYKAIEAKLERLSILMGTFDSLNE